MESILSVGVFVSIPAVGSAVVNRWVRPLPLASRVPLAVAIGLSLWTAPLLGSILLRIYQPELLGALGWLATALAITVGRIRLRRWPRPTGAAGWVLAIGLGVAGLLYAIAPAETLITGRDMAVYAAHGSYIAEHGRIDVPYPLGIEDDPGRPPAWAGYAGLYSTQPTQTVQFGHVFAAWLAQADSVGGYQVLQRLNPALAMVSALAVYAVALRWVPPGLAVLAALLVAFNPSQMWVARNTLTEIMTQLLVWAAFVLLLARAGPTRRELVLAGALVGMSSLVRIDSLVLVPLLLIGWALADARANPLPDPRPSTAFLLGLVPVSCLAVMYFATFSNPYFNALREPLLTIGVGTVAAGAAYLLTFMPPARIVIGAIVGSWPVIGAAVIGVMVAAGYAYFIRPNLGPFEVIDAPGHRLDGTRSHVEDAMVNLGRYLGGPTVWFAVGGWTSMMVLAVRRTPRWLPVLVVVGGFSALYMWNQSIFPDHFWAIRRFIPVVVPAMAVLAVVAVWLLLRRTSRSVYRVTVACLTLLVSVHTWQIGAPSLLLTDRGGTHHQLQRAAAAIPDGPVVAIFGSAVKSISTPLFMVFDVPLPSVDTTTEEGGAWVRQRLLAASPEHPVSVVTNMSGVTDFLDHEVLFRGSMSYEYIVPTVEPVPYEVGVRSLDLTVTRVVGADPIGRPFGGIPHWFIQDEGLHEPERFGSVMMRWTTGEASFRIPVSETIPTAMALSIASAGPAGATLSIRKDGMELSVITVPPSGWNGTIALPGVTRGELRIELITDTFVPAATPGMASADNRELGVLVHELTLLAADE